MLSYQSLERFHVLPAVRSHQRHHRLRRQPQFIRNRDPNPPITYIETHNPLDPMRPFRHETIIRVHRSHIFDRLSMPRCLNGLSQL